MLLNIPRGLPDDFDVANHCVLTLLVTLEVAERLGCGVTLDSFDRIENVGSFENRVGQVAC